MMLDQTGSSEPEVTREEEDEEEWEEEGSLLLRFETKNSRCLGQKTGAEGSGGGVDTEKDPE